MIEWWLLKNTTSFLPQIAQSLIIRGNLTEQAAALIDPVFTDLDMH